MVRTYSTTNIFSSKNNGLTTFLPRGVSFAGNESIGLDTIGHDPEDSQRIVMFYFNNTFLFILPTKLDDYYHI